MANKTSERRTGERDGLDPTTTGIAAALGVAALAGGAALLFGSRAKTAEDSDAPEHVLRGSQVAGRTVTINKPRDQLYAFWRDFTNLPLVMDNVEAVEILDDTRSRWTIKAPAGTSVTLVNRVVEDKPGERIAWESEPESQLANKGAIEFSDAAPGRGTMVRATVEYSTVAGPIGRGIAKLLQREPNVQARRDLRRFKQLMETGEVTSSASPSGRKSEDPKVQAL